VSGAMYQYGESMTPECIIRGQHRTKSVNLMCTNGRNSRETVLLESTDSVALTSMSSESASPASTQVTAAVKMQE
jgi:hypothetical protein